MTNKQILFCHEYIKDLNATRAYQAIYVGAKGKNSARTGACKLMARDEVQEHIKEKLESIRSAKIADAQEVMIYLSQVMRGEIDMPPRERNKAAELLAKRYGMLVENVNVQQVPIIIDDFGATL
ncbi:MAG: terminase small subunit [Clostridiales bacterium]|nr:terminase small subunit [Clostridiales bacterium]